MAENMRKNHDAAFKAKVVLEALKGDRTMAELPGVFSDRRRKNDKETEKETSKLYRQIGQLKIELDWLKKIPAVFIEEKRAMIDQERENITIRRQGELLGLPRASY